MIGTTEMQFGGMLTTALLALTLAFQLPRRVMRHQVYGKARWLMAGGLALLSAQFLLQYIGGYRQMGVTQAVFWNLLFFIPCTISINLALLYVQRKGKLNWRIWCFGVVLYLIVAGVLVGTALSDHIPFEEESEALRRAEYFGSFVFLLMQGHYLLFLFKGYLRMQRAVEEYFDHERHDLLGWMGRSVTMLAVITLFVPVVIFQEGWMLTIFASAFFTIIYYCASCFHSYGISQDTQRVEEAEQSMENDDTEMTLSDEDRERIERAAKRWAATGRYLNGNQTLTTVANDMDVQRYMLKAWLQQTKYGKLSNWINKLRIEEAQRKMVEHPDWSMEAVAKHCGLSTSSFHRIFRQITGITPAKFPRK